MILATQNNKQGGSWGDKTPASNSFLLWSPTHAPTGQTQPGLKVKGALEAVRTGQVSKNMMNKGRKQTRRGK